MRCVNPTRHEHGAFDCPHRNPDGRPSRTLHRWKTADGCSGECCMECFFELGVAQWSDLCQIAMLDHDGIPLAPGARTEGDWQVAMARVELQLGDILAKRPFRIDQIGPPLGPAGSS